MGVQGAGGGELVSRLLLGADTPGPSTRHGPFQGAGSAPSGRDLHFAG